MIPACRNNEKDIRETIHAITKGLDWKSKEKEWIWPAIISHVKYLCKAPYRNVRKVMDQILEEYESNIKGSHQKGGERTKC